MNEGRFDGGALSDDEKLLRDFYQRLLMLSATRGVLNGAYAHIPVDNDKVFAFARWDEDEQFIVVSNFYADREQAQAAQQQVEQVDPGERQGQHPQRLLGLVRHHPVGG